MGAGALICAPAAGQEIVYQPVNPAFGGNPFNADYLLGTATPQRPNRPSAPGSEPLTEAEQFARQIQSRLLSALSSSVVQAITGAAPGTTGEFTVGDQKIFFERTLSEIVLIITDTVTGEQTRIVVPVLNLKSAQAGNGVAPDIGGLPGGPFTAPSKGPAPGGSSSALTPSPLDGPPIEGGTGLLGPGKL